MLHYSFAPKQIDLPVLLSVHLVQHDEEQVKTGQQRVLEADVLHGCLVLVVLLKTISTINTLTQQKQVFIFRGGVEAYSAVDWVSGGQHGAAGVEPGVDPGFGDGDAALLHDFVDGRTVHVGHFVKLINAHHATVGKHHGPCLQTPLTFGNNDIFTNPISPRPVFMLRLESEKTF